MKKASHLHKYKIIKIKKATLTVGLFSILLLNGCSSHDKDTNVVTTPTVILTPTVTPENTITPSITIVPSSTAAPTTSNADNTATNEAGLLTAEDAQYLIEEKVDMKVYTVTLLADNVSVDGEDYYSFVVKKKNVAIEPVLVVNKVSGTVSCFEADGTISDYSNFPLYDASKDAICDWNGEFTRTDSNGESTGKIILAQGDTSSFEFNISVNTQGDDNLSGIAQITGNTAVYTDKNGFTITFVMLENTLKITEDGKNNYVSGDEEFTGTYAIKEDQKESENRISIDDAMELLSTLTIEQTKLPAEITEYKLISDDMEIVINGLSCYSFGVYSDFGDSFKQMNSYFVAVDGSKIFMFDVTSGTDIEIYSAK